MVERGEHFGFALEPRQPSGIAGEGGRQHLDGDRAPQVRIRRPVHLSHPARTDRGQQFVGAETGAGSKHRNLHRRSGRARIQVARERVAGIIAREGSRGESLDSADRRPVAFRGCFPSGEEERGGRPRLFSSDGVRTKPLARRPTGQSGDSQQDLGLDHSTAVLEGTGIASGWTSNSSAERDFRRAEPGGAGRTHRECPLPRLRMSSMSQRLNRSVFYT